MDMETASLVRGPNLQRGPAGRRRYPTTHNRSQCCRQQQVTAIQEFHIGDQGRQGDDRYASSASRSAQTAAAGGQLLALRREAQRLRPRAASFNFAEK
jgi:hypothetical protein